MLKGAETMLSSLRISVTSTEGAQQVLNKQRMNEYLEEGFKQLCIDQSFHFADEEMQTLSDLPKVTSLLNVKGTESVALFNFKYW